MRPLHVVNALRLKHVLERLRTHFGRAPGASLNGLKVLDVGCGGGLMSEPLALCGAKVVGIDASPGNIAAARLHANALGATLDYRLGDGFTSLDAGSTFDVVLALEVVEHVDDVAAFVTTAARLVAPGGLLFVSTVDRNFLSFVVAIVGAEYVLRVLPVGTHHWQRFVRPTELRKTAESAGVKLIDLRGMSYVPILHRASWSRSTRVNYMSTFARPAQHA
jgi:2-polyprenyl-6-hydroxyphenyl methylase/3-demethylubiquinone-9 3-methyltransferase